MYGCFFLMAVDKALWGVGHEITTFNFHVTSVKK